MIFLLNPPSPLKKWLHRIKPPGSTSNSLLSRPTYNATDSRRPKLADEKNVDTDVKDVRPTTNTAVNLRTPPAKKAFNWFGWKTSKGKTGLTSAHGGTEHVDVEASGGDWTPEPRPIRLFAPVYNGLGAGLSLFFVGSGLNVLIREWMLDGDPTRFLLLIAAPFLCCVSLFFSLQIITNISYVIAPSHSSLKTRLSRPSRTNRSIIICRV